MSARTTRANGRASRRLILDAAADIAGECGYQGTSISEVSKRSGLPNSSIYWHFQNKEDLFVALINDSYERWCEGTAPPSPDGGTASDGHDFDQLYTRLVQFPDFIRLGLMMALERTPDGKNAARQRFLEIRQEALATLRVALQADYPALGYAEASTLAATTLALLDGSFVAAVAGEPGQAPGLLHATIHTLATAMTAGALP